MSLSRRALLSFGVLIPVVGTIVRPLHAREPNVFASGGIAIGGYDPVAYFNENRPVAGRTTHSLMWRGSTWHFATAQSMEAFEMNPERFAPKYGGYCAYAMCKGAIAPTVPEAFTIHDDRLYLNFSTDVRAVWRQDVAENIILADTHWPSALY